MCGICGYIDLSGCPIQNEKIITDMCDAIRHRGPDDEGSYIKGNVVLGQRRLSIIDLVTGHQPIFNEDNSIAIVFNGEIYNFLEIKERLNKSGRHDFKTNSDTETIVHLYEEMGIDCLNELNGMFAFAIWDENKKTLFAARDRAGKKPFYYAQMGNNFVFASELKSLLKHPAIRKELDTESLCRYLAYEYVPAPKTIYKNIFKLEPGFYLTLKLENNTQPKLITVPYWDYKFSISDKPFEELQTELIQKLRKAVEYRLISDVPLGVFLSGGIDSSAITAMMADLLPPKNIKTFSIGFREKTFDETSYARLVANHFNTDHKEEMLEPSRLLEILPKIIYTLDEPMADPSIVPTYLLSEFTRKHVTVALGGDGGDELFAGYDPFLAHYPGKFLDFLPRSLISLAEKAAELLPVSHKNISFDFKIKMFLKGLRYFNGERHFAWLGSFAPHQLQTLLAPHVFKEGKGNEAFDVISYYMKRVDSKHDINNMIYLYLKLYMQDDILVKVDRASMANSLETRAPFLDKDFIEFANSIPPKYKLHNFTTKYILKKSLEGKIPNEILYRRKKGFGVPIGEWFRKDLQKPLIEIVNGEIIKDNSIFNPAAVKKLIDDHINLKADNRKQLWTLFIFANWKKTYLD